MSLPPISLDDLARYPAQARTLASEQRAELLTRCASVLAALAASSMVTDAPDRSGAARDQVAAAPDKLLTAQEVAARLGYAVSHVYEMLRRGDLPAVRDRKFVRVRQSELSAFIASHERRGPLPKVVSNMLSSRHDRKRPETPSAAARHDAGSARGAHRRASRNGQQVGDGNDRDS